MTYAGDLTPQEAWDLLAENPAAVLVDVRTEGEWRQVGVPDMSDLPGDREVGFVQWATPFGPNEDFLAELASVGIEPGDGRPVIFLCRSGNRSIGAATEATRAGFGPSYNVLEGFEGDADAYGRRGINGWVSRGLPATTYTGE